MRYREIIDEAFGAPVKWQITKQTDTHFEVKFKINAVTYDVSLFRYDRENDGWELSFTAATKTKEFGFAPSGTGNAWTVFGTVINIARKFIALKKPNVIKIESDITERSRVAVNLRIARAIANELPYAIEDENYHIFVRRLPEAPSP
jgi:hypothetical protein